MSNRSVATDALATLGTIIDETQKRDAIHIAVEPVVAGESGLRPGNHITIVNGEAFAADEGEGLGIVDPFLPQKLIKKGQRFWFLMYPRMVTSLRHVWAHPAFEDEAEIAALPRISKDDHLAKSRAWIAEHANVLGLSADALMEHAAEWLETEDYIVQQGSERWRDNFNPTEFWHHYEIVTGTTVDASKKHSFFCCSC